MTTSRRQLITGLPLAAGGWLAGSYTTFADTIAGLGALTLPEGWSRTERHANGVAVEILAAEHPAPVLSIPLNVPSAGEYELHLGMVIRSKKRNAAMQIKTSGAEVWRRVRPMRFADDSVFAIQEASLGVFRLEAGSELMIRTEPVSYAGIAGIRLTPAAVGRAPSLKKSAPAGVVFDTNMAMSTYRIEQPDDLHTILAPYADSTFTHIFWGTGVGSYSPLYFSEALGWHGEEQREFMADHRARTAGVMRMFARHNVDPLAHAVEFAHANGLQLWANDRISKNHEHDFRDDFPGGRFLSRHRDKRVLLSSGAPHHQCTMSFAYPEIREMKTRTLVEQARYEIDGLYIDFVRKPPLVGWEPAVLDSFKKQHGIDPKQAPRDEWFYAWIDHRCGFVTEFMRELRDALKGVERERGRRIPLMAQVNGDWRFTSGFPSCRMEGLDPVVWAKEGLIDYLAPSEPKSLWHQDQSLDRWRQLLTGTECKLWGAMAQKFREGQRSTEEREQFGPEHTDLDPWRVMRHAADLYNQGAEGVYIWEAHDVPAVPERWNVLKRLGDREHLKEVFGTRIGPYDGSHAIPQTVIEP